MGDDPAELALAADLPDGLRPEAGIKYVVADLPPLMRPLGVVVREPQRHDAVGLLGREADVRTRVWILGLQVQTVLLASTT